MMDLGMASGLKSKMASRLKQAVIAAHAMEK